MKKTLKSAVSLLLTLCMALSLGGVSALADGEPLPTITDNVTVTTSNDTVTVNLGPQAAVSVMDVVTITLVEGEKAANIAANIAASGDNNTGITANSSTVMVNGNVSTTGDSSDGVDAGGSTITVGGDVSTTGDHSDGVDVNNSTVTVDGDVSTTGVYSAGVYANISST